MSKGIRHDFDWQPVATADLTQALTRMKEFLSERPDCAQETRDIFENDIIRCEAELKRRETESPEETYKRNKQILDTNGTSY